MVYTRSVSLSDIPGSASVQFLSAEIPIGEGLYAPFVLINYALEGEQQEYGLCLDLDKQVFIHHFYDDQEKEEVLLKAAPKITEFLSPILENLYREDEERKNM